MEVVNKYHFFEDVNTMMTRVNRKVAFGTWSEISLVRVFGSKLVFYTSLHVSHD